MAGQTPRHDDPIRRLRENYAERLRIYERRDRIETCVLFVFLWYFFSFWSIGLLLIVFGELPTVLLVLGATACGLLVTLPVFAAREVLFPGGEPGLLGWWDERRRGR